RRIGLGRRLIEGVAQPAVPVGRHLGSLSVAVIDHPAALATVIAGRVPRLIIAIAELVRAHQLAALGDSEQGADGRPVPPGENLSQQLQHLDTLSSWESGRRGVPGTAANIETAAPGVQRPERRPNTQYLVGKAGRDAV